MKRETTYKLLRIAIIFFLLFQLTTISFVAFAQESAVSVLEKAAATFEAAGGISANFTSVTKESGKAVTETTEGTINIKGDKFVLITPEMHTFFNGTTQWVYVDASEEVNISNPTDDELLFINPALLLKNYKKGFNASAKSESTTGGTTVYNIELTPHKNGNITKVALQIDKTSLLPTGIIITMKNGITSTIQISKIKKGLNQPDSYFVFREVDYPDTEVIDLR